ncbi:MAG: winged helix-turn-helix transcriptional regulator [Eggerthellaceae bacterium]|nr:winged helix-turn-helix transcriptional regulator [Eggerthellaceae bacterium]
MRFNELLRRFPKMPHATLSNQLKQLEADGLVKRTGYAQIPPKVEYSLTEISEKFRPVLDAIQKFGRKYIKYMEERDAAS